MTISELEKAIQATDVKVSADTLSVDLEDGRTISVPLDWYPRLVHGSARERSNWEIGRFGIHWPDLDEDISIAGLLAGRQSGESQQSLRKWLDQRTVKVRKKKK
jgi:hypothetical protein